MTIWFYDLFWKYKLCDKEKQMVGGKIRFGIIGLGLMGRELCQCDRPLMLCVDWWATLPAPPEEWSQHSGILIFSEGTYPEQVSLYVVSRNKIDHSHYIGNKIHFTTSPRESGFLVRYIVRIAHYAPTYWEILRRSRRFIPSSLPRSPSVLPPPESLFQEQSANGIYLAQEKYASENRSTQCYRFFLQLSGGWHRLIYGAM